MAATSDNGYMESIASFATANSTIIGSTIAGVTAAGAVAGLGIYSYRFQNTKQRAIQSATKARLQKVASCNAQDVGLILPQKTSEVQKSGQNVQQLRDHLSNTKNDNVPQQTSLQITETKSRLDEQNKDLKVVAKTPTLQAMPKVTPVIVKSATSVLGQKEKQKAIIEETVALDPVAKSYVAKDKDPPVPKTASRVQILAGSQSTIHPANASPTAALKANTGSTCLCTSCLSKQTTSNDEVPPFSPHQLPTPTSLQDKNNNFKGPKTA